MWLCQMWNDWRASLRIVKPDTVTAVLDGKFGAAGPGL
jgi:hypothetical protein